MATATIVTFTQTPIYEATSRVLVKFGRQYVYRPEVGEEATLINRDHEFIVNAELEILSSEDLVVSVIEKLGVAEIYPDLAPRGGSSERNLSWAVRRFKQNLDTVAMPSSDVLRLSFKHANPEMAARATNLAVELFQNKHVEAFGSRPVVQFLERQVAVYRETLDRTEQEIQTFHLDGRTVSLKEESEALLRQRSAIAVALHEIDSEMVGLDRKLSALGDSLREISEDTALYTETAVSAPVDDAKKELLRLQLQEQELLARFREGNRNVVNVRKQLKLVEDFLVEQEKANPGTVRVGKNRIHEDIKLTMVEAGAERAALVAKRAPLQRQAAEIDKALAAIPVQERGLRALQRRREQDERNYQTYVRRLEEARISKEMDRERIADVVVIQRASVPLQPIGPNKRTNLSIAALLGLVAGLGLAFLSEIVGQAFTTPASAERSLGLPVIAVVQDHQGLPAPPPSYRVVL